MWDEGQGSNNLDNDEVVHLSQSYEISSYISIS